MPSLNKVMNMWHAYKRVDKKRVHLGYYVSQDDATEAEKLGHRTDKAWSHNKRSERKADTTVKKLVGRLSQEGQS